MKRTMCEEHTVRNKTRYQYGNHLDSASLELDVTGNIISYEEYFPYGDTSFIAGTNQKEVKLKEYRYTGKEKDDVTGLYYYGARYYASWLGRWMSADPLFRENPSVYEKPKGGSEDERKKKEEEFKRKLYSEGLNLYGYVKGNPVRLVDPTGFLSDEEIKNNGVRQEVYIPKDSILSKGESGDKPIGYKFTLNGESRYQWNNEAPSANSRIYLGDPENAPEGGWRGTFSRSEVSSNGNASARSAVSSLQQSFSASASSAGRSLNATSSNNQNSSDRTLHEMFPQGTPHRIWNNYGMREDPFTRRRSWHGGEDVWAPAGTRLLSLTGGAVTEVGNMGRLGLGRYVRVTIGNVEITYAHLQSVNVQRGQAVNVETLLGRVGQTGRATGPHVHIEVRINGRVVDPQTYFRRGN